MSHYKERGALPRAAPSPMGPPSGPPASCTFGCKTILVVVRCNLEVSGGTAGMTADLRREAAGGPPVATMAKPVDDGGARLLVEDDELEGAVVVAVLLGPDGRVIAQRRTVVGGEA